MNLQSVSKGIQTLRKALGTAAKVTSASESVAVVVKSDTVALAVDCVGLWVGGTGAVAVTMWDGTTATFTAVPAGTLLPISPMQVMSTGTTATLIVALY